MVHQRHPLTCNDPTAGLVALLNAASAPRGRDVFLRSGLRPGPWRPSSRQGRDDGALARGGALVSR